MGAVVRLHRIRTVGEYEGLRAAEATTARGRSLTSWVFGDGALSGAAHGGGGASFTWTAADSERVAALHRWSRDALCSPAAPLAATRVAIHTVADAVGAGPPIGTVHIDMVVRLQALSSRAAIAATSPAQHGWDGADSITLFDVVDGPPPPPLPTPTAAAAAEASNAAAADDNSPLLGVWLDGRISPRVAQPLVYHLQQLRCADMSAGWLRLRNVRLVGASHAAVGAPQATLGGALGGGSGGCRATALGLLIEPSTSVMLLPHGHALIPTQPTHPLRAHAPTAAHGVATGPAAGAPTAAQGAPTPAPPARCHPTVAATSSFAAARASSAAPFAAPTASPTAGPPHGPHAALTTLSLPPALLAALPLQTIRGVIDAHTRAPCLLRVRARVVQIFPAQPQRWTYQNPRQGMAAPSEVRDMLPAEPLPLPTMPATACDATWSYRLVLQLADPADDEPAFLGAAVHGPEGARFFSGLPAADLERSNATLAALQSRVAPLMAGDSAEYCLWAHRPVAADQSERGVAYHVVATHCL